MTPRDKAVLAALPGTADIVAADAGVKTVNAALRRLAKQGLCFERAGGWWSLTGEGFAKKLMLGPKLPWLVGAACDACPLIARPAVPMVEGAAPGGVLVVGEAPGATEVDRGMPFVGRSGRLLRDHLRRLGIGGECWYTNTCSCRPVDNATPGAKAVKACAGRLAADIAKARPTVIIALGGSASRALGAGSLTTRHGMPARHSSGATVIATYHPAAVLRDPSLEAIFRDDLQRAAALYRADGVIDMPPDPPIHVVALDPLNDELPCDTLLACDIETDGLLLPSKLLSIAFSDGKECWVTHLDMAGFDTALSRVFAPDTGRRFLWHNGKFDCLHLRSHGAPAEVDEDTFLMAHAIDERGEHGLEYLVGQHLGVYGYKQEALHGGTGKAQLKDTDVDTLLRYNALDAYYDMRLYRTMLRSLRAESTEGAYRLMVNAVAPLLDMEKWGMVLDTARVAEVEEHTRRSYEDNVAKAQKLLVWGTFVNEMDWPTKREDVNPQSTKVLQDLMVRMGILSPDKYGKVTTNAVTLRNIRESSLNWQGELAGAILDMRHDQKLLSSYVRKLPGMTNDLGRVRTKLNLTGTGTGRLSSGGDGLINMQNIAGVLKSLFVAEDGWWIVNADLSQAEIRTLAHFVQDPRLNTILTQGIDTHVAVASLLFGVPPEAVDKKMRTAGKRLNFALLYGMGEPSLARELGCSLAEAHALTVKYYARFPKVPEWKYSVEQTAITRGYVEYSIGRRRHFAPPQDKTAEAAIKRAAVDTVIQGTASDVLQTVLAGLYERWHDDSGIRFVNTVHDSIMVEARPERVEPFAHTVADEVSRVPFDVFGMQTPFLADVEVGLRWSDMVDVEKWVADRVKDDPLAAVYENGGPYDGEG